MTGFICLALEDGLVPLYFGLLCRCIFLVVLVVLVAIGEWGYRSSSVRN
jgi:hypothetical protein